MHKRLLVLFLSFGTIIAFGYALGGLGGYIFDQGKPMMIAAGLAGGIVSAFLALKIWKSYLDDIERENRAAGISSQGESDIPEDNCQFPEEK